MLKRILTAAVLIPLLILVLIFSDTLAFPIIWSLLAAVAVFEMTRVLGAVRDLCLTAPAYLLAAGLPEAAYFLHGDGRVIKLTLAAAILYLLWLFFVAVIRRGALGFSTLAAVYASALYIAFGFSSIAMLRFGVDNGAQVYLLIFIGPWVTDTFAYFCGRFFGRRKLIPEISPKKTVAGAVGGTVSCVIAFVVFALVMQFYFDRQVEFDRQVNYFLFASAGLLTALVAQIGDLIASLIKREHSVKDYGNIFPGHGGVLDRFDSVLSTAPFLWLLFSSGGILAFFSAGGAL